MRLGKSRLMYFWRKDICAELASKRVLNTLLLFEARVTEAAPKKVRQSRPATDQLGPCCEPAWPTRCRAATSFHSKSSWPKTWGGVTVARTVRRGFYRL